MIKWNNNLDTIRIELLNNGYSYKETANIMSNKYNLNITYKSVKNRSERTKTTIKNLNENIISFNPIKNYIRELKDIYNYFYNLDINKILVLSDLHCPYVNVDFINTAINENKDAELCILNGDILDCSSFSKYDNEYDFSITKELKIAKKIFDKLSKTFKYIIYIKGNHEKRFEKFINNLPLKNNKNYFSNIANPMYNLSKQYKNVIFVDNYFIQLFDIIFAHPANYSTGILKTVNNVNLDMKSKREILPNKDYKAVIIGHTHQLGNAFTEDNIYIAEIGCMCNLQPYKYTNSNKTMWQPGYMVINIKNKKIDINNSKLYYLEYDYK